MPDISLNVPIEIIEHIIDMLHDDFCSLKTCSLVCRGWLTRARYNIFVEFNPNFPGASRQLSSLELEDMINSLQQSSLPFFAIERLTLGLTDNGRDLGVLLWPCWHQSVNITELDLHGLGNLDICLPPFVNRLPRLRQLTIVQTQFASTISVLRIIADTPQLSGLKLSHVSWEKYERQMDVLPCPIPLRHLTLYHAHDLDAFIDLLLAAHPDLILWSLWTHHLDSDRVLMDKCCAHLRTLDLRYHRAASFDLTTYVSLHTLILPQAVYRDGPIPEGFLASIISASFSNLTLFLMSGDPESLIEDNRDTFPWALIDKEMEDYHPSASILIVEKDLNSERLRNLGFDLAEGMSELLPRCAKRGMLKGHPCDAKIWRDLHVHLG